MTIRKVGLIAPQPRTLQVLKGMVIMDSPGYVPRGGPMLTHLMFFMLAGCPDPTTAADLGNPGPGGGAPGPGGAGTEGAPQGPPPEPGNFSLDDGAGVTVSGTLKYTGEAKGGVRIDVLRKEDDAPPQLLHVEKLDAPGAFSFQAPSNTGEVSLVAFVDVDDDGPSPSDPAGRADIEIAEETVGELVIDLSDEPELGDLTPGDAPAPADVLAEDGAAPTNPEVGTDTPEAPPTDAPEAPAVEAPAATEAEKTEPSEAASE